MSSQAQSSTPQGQPQEVIGGGLDAGVVSQIIERENLISQQRKSKEHLLFFNGNGAWARMVSSVNTITAKEAEELVINNKTISEVSGDSNLARQNILMSGVVTQNTRINGGINENKYHSPIKLDGSGYVTDGLPAEGEPGFGVLAPQNSDLKTNAYHNYESLGFRPTPGIESVDVKSKGTYGTLREAEVNFKVWTLEDLEVMQKLYLRPGYSVLLEWGHSQQLNSSTDKGTINSNVSTYKKFFDNIEGDTNNDVMLEMEKALKQIAGEADFNYDSFVGYISNFNWTLNELGGYDCFVKIIAKGSILESIRITFDPSEVFPADQMSPRETNKGKQERKSIYHKFFAELKKTTKGNSQAAANLNRDVGIAGAVGLPGTIAARNAINFWQFAASQWKAGSTNWPAVKSYLSAELNRNIELIDNAGQALEDFLFGSKAEAFSQMNTVDSIEGKFAMENKGFKKKIDKLKKGDSFRYTNAVGITYTESFEGIEERDFITGGGFTAMEEEEAVYYFKKNFNKYGFKFEEGTTSRGWGFNFDGMKITAKNGETIKVALDKTAIAESRRDSAKIVDFITENAYLPTSELTEEQKQFRTELEQLKKAYEEYIKRLEQTNKENNVQQSALNSEGAIEPIYTKGKFALDTAQHFKTNLNDFAAFRVKGLELKDTGFFDNDDLNEFWVPLYVILDIYNNYVTLIDGTKKPKKGSKTPGRKLTQFYTGFQDTKLSGKYEKKLKYLTTPLHFSINPMVCVLPSPPTNIVLKTSDGEKVPWPDGSTSYPIGQIWKNGFNQQVQKALTSGIMKGEVDDILNILVSGQLVLDELDKIVAQAEDSDSNENNNVVYFLRTLLRKMNEAMGGINDLDLFYDEVDDLYYIVDRKVTPALRNFIPKLSLSGIKSTMSNVSISSEISNRIGNMVAIAAQGVGDKSKENVSTLLKWNAGLIDRHVRHKADTAGPDEVKELREKPEDKRLKKWVEDYYDYWREFNGDKFWDSGDWNQDMVSALGNFHKRFCQKYVVTEYQKGDVNNPLPPPGTIPVELSFSTIGIGGMKIGQAFMIENGLLPENYSKNFGYIITGLDHKIGDNKWITTVKTQFYSITPPTNAELEYFKKVRASTESYVLPIPTGGDPAAGGTPGPGVPYDPVDSKLPGDGSVYYEKEPPKGGRPLAIQQKLMDILVYAASQTGLKVKITSKGNIPLSFAEAEKKKGGAKTRKAIFIGNGAPNGGGSVGSARHDNGYGVDFKLYNPAGGGSLNIAEGSAIVQSFLRACRLRGAHSFGFGSGPKGYMGGKAIHLDIACGTSKYGNVAGTFSVNDTLPRWGKDLYKATKVLSGQYKNTFKKSENLIAANGERYYNSR